VSWLGTYPGTYAGSWWGPIGDAAQPSTGGGSGVHGQYRARRIVSVIRRVEQAAQRAAGGDFLSAAALAAKAAANAATQARMAKDDDAAALDALSREIMAAGQRIRDASASRGLDKLQALVAFRAALEAAYQVQSLLRGDDEEMAALTLLMLH
jgi:hypothetical protein